MTDTAKQLSLLRKVITQNDGNPEVKIPMHFNDDKTVSAYLKAVYSSYVTEALKVNRLPFFIKDNMINLKSKNLEALTDQEIDDFNLRLETLFELLNLDENLVLPVNHNYKYMVWWATGCCNAWLLQLIVGVHPELFYVESPKNMIITLNNPFEHYADCPQMLQTLYMLFFSPKPPKVPQIYLDTEFMRKLKKMIDREMTPGPLKNLFRNKKIAPL